MKYHYAIINKVGMCTSVHKSNHCICDPYHVPIEEDNETKYLEKYYWPILDFVDNDADFNGSWYLDAKHTIEEVAL